MQAHVKVLWPATIVAGLALGFGLGTRFASPFDSDDRAELLRLARRQERQLEDLQALIHDAMQRSPGPPGDPPPPGPVDARAPRAGSATAEPQAPRASQVPEVEPAPAPEAQPTEPEAQPTQVSLEARDAGLRLIEAAVSNQRWGDVEAERLEALLARMAEAQQDEVIQRLVTAINRGDVQVVTQGPPF